MDIDFPPLKAVETHTNTAGEKENTKKFAGNSGDADKLGKIEQENGTKLGIL